MLIHLRDTCCFFNERALVVPVDSNEEERFEPNHIQSVRSTSESTNTRCIFLTILFFFCIFVVGFVVIVLNVKNRNLVQRFI